MPNETVPAGQGVDGCHRIPALIHRWSRVRDQPATKHRGALPAAVDYTSRPLPRRAPRGWRRVRRDVAASAGRAAGAALTVAVWLAAVLLAYRLGAGTARWTSAVIAICVMGLMWRAYDHATAVASWCRTRNRRSTRRALRR